MSEVGYYYYWGIASHTDLIADAFPEMAIKYQHVSSIAYQSVYLSRYIDLPSFEISSPLADRGP